MTGDGAKFRTHSTTAKSGLDLTDVARECAKIAEDHGFAIKTEDVTINVPTALCLIHSEVSEALEAYRHGQEIGEELADIVIRVFHLSQVMKIDIEKEILLKMEKNRSRPYKHGKRL